MWGFGMCPLDGWSLAFDIPNGLGLQVVLFGAGLPCAVLLRVVSDCGSLVEASSSHCDHSFGLVNGVPFWNMVECSSRLRFQPMSLYLLKDRLRTS